MRPLKPLDFFPKVHARSSNKITTVLRKSIHMVAFYMLDLVQQDSSLHVQLVVKA